MRLRTFCRRNSVLLLLIFVFLAAQMFVLSKYRLLIWDEAAYVGIGKYIYSAGSVGLLETVRPLALPMMLGMVWKLGGGVFAYKALAIAFSAGVVALTYFISKEIFDGAYGRYLIAGFAAALVAFSPGFFSSSAMVLTDIPSVFFALAAVYLFLKGRLFLSGLFGAVAFMFRFPHFLVLPAVAAAVLFSAHFSTDNMKKWKVALSGALSGLTRLFFPLLFVFAAFMSANYILYRSLASGIFEAMLMPIIVAYKTQANIAYSVSGFSNNLMFYFRVMLEDNLFLLFSVTGLLFLLRQKERKKLVVAFAAIAYFAYFTLIENKQPRFLIAFLPFAAILSAYWLHKSLFFMRRLNIGFRFVFAFVLSFLVVFSAVSMAQQDYKYYALLPASESPVVSDVYSYFSQQSNLTILTTDPVFAVFSDNRFIPYYENPDSALKTYDEQSGNADFVVYTPHFFPCEKFGPECENKKQQLFDKIRSGKRLVLNKSVDDRSYYIFSSAHIT